MENQAQKLIVRRARDRAAAIEALAPAVERGTIFPLQSIDEHCAGADFFEVMADSATVCVYALEVREHRAGREGVIVAAAGSLPGRSLTRRVLPVIEAQLADCDLITVHTRRQGLAHQLARAGFVFDGLIMRKRVHGVPQ